MDSLKKSGNLEKLNFPNLVVGKFECQKTSASETLKFQTYLCIASVCHVAVPSALLVFQCHFPNSSGEHPIKCGGIIGSKPNDPDLEHLFWSPECGIWHQTFFPMPSYSDRQKIEKMSAGL